MPTELRHLLFRPAEVVQAVRDYHRRLGTPLPAGAIVQCGPECEEGDEGAVSFRITLVPDPAAGTMPGRPGEERPREVVVEGAVLAAALILHCRDRRIPMPANAGKSLRCLGTQVCLVATLNPKQDDLPHSGPLRL